MTAPAVSVRVPGRPSRGYDVVVEEGLLGRLGELCREVAPAPRYAVLSDRSVATLYGDRALASLEAAGLSADLHVFPDGESSKSRDTWTELTDTLLEVGHGRDSVVVALGGGVTGDLAGFVAATYMRGLPLVQVPTTLLAMVDSAVGGKTAVDTPAGKNLVGAFHHPVLVAVDPALLETLEPRHVSAGLSEVVKTAAVADATLLDGLEGKAGRLLAGDLEPAAALVRRCVALKADVVGADPEEAGRRAVLNFGHTVGHALERLEDFRMLHGEAVAAGMRVEARLGELLGVTRRGTAARLAAVLDACGHTSRPEAGHRAEEVLEAAATDKKGRSGVPRFVLLAEPGRVARTSRGGYTHDPGTRDLIEMLGYALRGEREDADSGTRALGEPDPSPTRGSAPRA